MKESDFLKKLYKQKKLQWVEQSDEICSSYMEKAKESLKAAQVLTENNLLENAVAMAYYAMYHCLTAALFKSGIKCENHTASIKILRLVFEKEKLSKNIEEAKKERIDKQYYVSDEQEEISSESAVKLNEEAEDFLLQMKVFTKSWSNNDKEGFKRKLNALVDSEETESKSIVKMKINKKSQAQYAWVILIIFVVIVVGRVLGWW